MSLQAKIAMIIVIVSMLALCSTESYIDKQHQEEAWQVHHDKYKWGDPPMPHGNDTNSVMNPYGTNSFWNTNTP